MSRWFVTGCGSGFGLALTRQLLQEGHEVVGTDVSLPGLRERVSRGLHPDVETRLTLRRLELRDPESVEAATADAGPIDVLVNNAGYAVFGTQAEGAPEAVEALFQANVFGAIRVTRALLPTLRARAGAIVQLSSVAGRMVFPESGFYAATKHALEALSEALYLENHTFGVRVIVIEPGAYETGFLARALAESGPRAEDSPYRALHDLWDTRKADVLEPPQRAHEVARAIVDAVARGAGFERVPVGRDARHLLALRALVTPDAWVRLQAERLGGPPAGLPFASPEEVLATAPEALAATWPATVLAAHGGQLAHWAEVPGGADALAKLLGSPG